MAKGQYFISQLQRAHLPSPARIQAQLTGSAWVKHEKGTSCIIHNKSTSALQATCLLHPGTIRLWPLSRTPELPHRSGRGGRRNSSPHQLLTWFIPKKEKVHLSAAVTQPQLGIINH